MTAIARYLKKHSEALVKDVGIEAACELTGKSKATLGRYYSDYPGHADRFMPIDAVALLEEASSYPHVTAALAELKGITLSFDERRKNSKSEGGVISANEAKRLLNETLALQQVLIDMKLHLEDEHS